MPNLDVPYLSQLDNFYNPYGSCNVTSMAMVMKYFGRANPAHGQLEDAVYKYFMTTGFSRHSPYDIAKAFTAFSIKDELNTKADLASIRDAIDDGKPCIVHGYFTKFGHIVVVRGYDDTGFFVNDPYGEYFERGYNTNTSGENLHYSNLLMSRTCQPEGPGHIWLHVCSKA